MFNNFDFDDFFERFMEGFLKVLIVGLVLFLILLVIVGVCSLFFDIGSDDFIKIIHNDGNVRIYKNPSMVTREDDYLKFRSEGKTYTIFYKDIKSIEQYDEDIAKRVY